MARLDRLAAVKDVAQTAASLGRDVSHDLIAAVASFTQSTLGLALDQLVEAGVLVRRGNPPDAVYGFRHALLQDAAYASLLRSRRQQLHRTVAQAIEAQFP